MASIPDYLNGLSEAQLKCCYEKAGKMLDAKRREEKKIVWRVCSGRICYGNFRTEDYLKALDCVVETGKEEWDPADLDNPCLKIEIVAERVPASEYESYFD